MSTSPTKAPSIGVPERTRSATQLIQRHSLFAAGAGLIPVDGLDLAAITGIQINMIRELAVLYQKDFNDRLVQVVLSSVVTATLPRLTSEVFSTLGVARWLQLLGSNLSASALAGWLTREVGHFYLLQFAKGKEIHELTMADVTDYIEQQFQSGGYGLSAFQLPAVIRGMFPKT